MSFTAALRSVFSKYVDFDDRARRAEYWWFTLFLILVAVVTSILDGVLGTNFEGSVTSGAFGLIANLVLLLPSLAVTVRRLHDTDRSGWWIFIGLIPILGPIVLLVFFVEDGKPGPNRFGDSPKYHVARD